MAQRVIASRPEQQNAQWAQTLSEHGFTVERLPLLRISVVEEAALIQAVKNCIVDVDNYQKLIFVSQNAVEFGMDWIDRYWPQLPTGIDWYAIGKKTQKALHSHLSLSAADLAIDSPVLMNTEGLLELPALQDLSLQKILVLRGVGGRTKLGDELQARGARVDYCELYHRLVPDGLSEQIAKLCLNESDILPVFSGESLQNLTQCDTDARSLALRLIVPSERVARQAERYGFGQIAVADNASEAAMMQQLIALTN